MKKITQIVIAAMIVLGATAFISFKSKSARTQPVQVDTVWFNTIEIAKGITVEFEYGPRLQVFVEGDKELITQLAVVLEDQVLKATGKNQSVLVSGIRIKVVTPVLINLARYQSPSASHELPQVTGEHAVERVVVKPVLTRQKLFQVYVSNA
jgi:hypothetical protein